MFLEVDELERLFHKVIDDDNRGSVLNFKHCFFRDALIRRIDCRQFQMSSGTQVLISQCKGGKNPLTLVITTLISLAPNFWDLFLHMLGQAKLILRIAGPARVGLKTPALLLFIGIFPRTSILFYQKLYVNKPRRRVDLRQLRNLQNK